MWSGLNFTINIMKLFIFIIKHYLKSFFNFWKGLFGDMLSLFILSGFCFLLWLSTFSLFLKAEECGSAQLSLIIKFMSITFGAWFLLFGFGFLIHLLIFLYKYFDKSFRNWLQKMRDLYNKHEK